MYRTKRLFGWIFQKYYPDRGWYRWHNFIISDAPNQLYGPYKTRKQAFFPSSNSFLLQRIEYYLTKPTGNVYYDTRKEKDNG